MLRVLYVHCAGPFGGSSRSLFEMVRAIDAGECEYYFLCQSGTSNKYFSQLGKVFGVSGLSQFDHGRYSFYRGLRWAVLARELYYLPHVIYGALQVKQSLKNIDVIHINDFVGVVPAILIKFLFDAPVVCHVRSLVNSDTRLIRTRVINKFLCAVPNRVVCIDENVRRTISSEIRAEVIHNGLVVESRGEPLKGLRDQLGTALRIGFMGNLLLQKGVLELIQAAAIVHAAGLPIEVHIYGDAAKEQGGLKGMVLGWLGLKQNVKERLLNLIEVHALAGVVKFHGFVDDLRSAYENIDVVCFPSHLNAPGRPVIEAAYFGRPAIVSVVDPTPDTIVHGVTGLAVAGNEPRDIAEAIQFFILNREKLLEMGGAARRLYEKHYDQIRNSKRMLEIYKNLKNTRS